MFNILFTYLRMTQLTRGRAWLKDRERKEKRDESDEEKDCES